MKRWPLYLIAAPAAVAIWSGWVGLGELCGFGPVRLLPGITDWTLNTAITLPIGVEAYAAYALGAWMNPDSPEGARTFARRSALGALVYGMAGQVIYHLLAASHATRAPVPVVVIVSCMPVAVLGLAAALTHLLRAEPKPEVEPSPDVPAAAPVPPKLWPHRQVRDDYAAGDGTAKKIRAAVRTRDREWLAVSNGHANGNGNGPHV